VPIAAVPGNDPEGGPAGTATLDTAITLGTSYVNLGGSVTVTLNVKSSAAVSNVTPTPLDISGGAATCTGPTPASANVPVGGTGVDFVWTCTTGGVGELIFSAGAEDALATYGWPTASSASLLSSPGGGTDVVTWSLGSNTPRVVGEIETGGIIAAVYGFRGDNKNEFSRYGIRTASWTSRAVVPDGIEKGGSLTTDGNGRIWALEGNSKDFYRYDISTNTWTARAETSNNANEGGAVQYLNVGGTEYVYALLGNSNRFRRYSVSGNTWSNMADTPASVKRGGALTTDGTYLYALRGDGKKDFWRCNATTAGSAGSCDTSWTTMAPTPENVKWGGALTRVGNYIYATRGDGKTTFWRYDIAANNWTAMAPTPGNVDEGGALATDGSTYIYAFQGKTKTFWRYSVAGNTWTALSAANFTGNVRQGGALVYHPAINPEGRTTVVSADPSLVSTGDTITVRLETNSSTAVANVTPSAVTITPTGAASASLLSGPTLLSADDDIADLNDPVVYEWTYSVTAGTNPGSLTFTMSASGDAGATSFPSASSKGLIVSPVLTFQATVTSGAPAVIENTGLLLEQNTLGSVASNTTETATSASIGDFVWADANGDGLQAGELGLAGVEVCVYQSDGTTLIGCDTTDASGAYRVFGLAAGSYVVRTNPDTYPSGFVPTTAGTLNVTLTASQQYDLADFGLQPAPANPGSIGDTVWLDANENGVKDAGETGLSGVTVRLERLVDGVWTQVATSTTDADGAYLFSGLPAGDYRVTVDESATVTSPYDPLVTSTIADAMDLVYANGQATPTNPTATITLGAAQNYLLADFGYNWGGSIGDFVWYDGNADGVPDAGDGSAPGCITAPCGAPGATLVLFYDVNGNSAFDPGIDAPLESFETGDDGLYLFDNLPPGNYVVVTSEQEVPSPTTGQIETMVHTVAEAIAVALIPNQAFTDADFGLAERALVEGTVFHDVNNNGVFDAGDIPLAGVTVTLSGQDENNNPVSLTTTTDSNGEYVFLVLGGDYVVTYTTGIPAGLTQPTTPTSLSVEVLNGIEYGGLDFGVTYTGSLGDRVWNDANGDGSQTTGELGIPGVTVELYASDGTTLLRVTTTDSSGLYSFGGLADGTYVVRVLPPDGFTPTGEGDPGASCQGPPSTCDNAITAAVSGGAANNAVDFGYEPVASTYPVSGTVWDDNGASGGTAGNGIQDGGEPGIPGVTVCLRNAADDSLVGCTVTGSNGDYSFPGVEDGGYRVVVDPATLPTNAYVQTGDPDGTLDNQTPITVAGAPVTDRDFGYQQNLGSIAGSVCFGNGDGQCATAETKIPGVEVALYRQDGNGVFLQVGSPVTTGAGGTYLFDDLVPGTYQVRETNPAFLIGTLADADGGNPDNISVVLGLGQDVTGRDFEEQAASIGDRVWFDTNQDGIQDPAEPGIAGVTVTLTGTDGFGTAVNLTTTTDGSGIYRFDGLAGGIYDVTFTAPTGYQFTLQNAGTGPLADSFDSDAVSTTGKVLGIVASGDNVTVDAGLYLTNGALPARISDFVWYDTDNDGIQDGNEPGLAGVTVKLFADVNQDGQPDSPTPIATTVSDGNGFYEFAGLPAGSYVAGFATPAGYTRSPQGAGGDPALDSDADVTSGLTDTITLVAGDELTDIDAGMYIDGVNPANLGDRVWYDTNGNGIQDAGEPGLPGVVVNLYNATGAFVATTRTDIDGLYTFGGLAAGAYSVEFVAPAGYLISPPSQGANPALDSNPNPTTGLATVTLVAGVTEDSIDAGMRNPLSGPLSIGDFVWLDANGNGEPDAGEGLANVQVVLYDALGQELVRVTTTAADANYLFTGIGAGDYRVAIDTSTLPAEVQQIVDPDGVLDHRTDLVNLVASTDEVDFGYQQLRSIRGTVLADLINLGDIDNPGDTPLLGVVVELRDAVGDVIATTVTDSDGNYSFGNLLPGAYQVTTVTPPGANHVIDADGNGNGANLIEITLVADDVTGRDFLLDNVTTYAITGTVFNDTGTVPGDFDGSDTPLGGVTVELRDSAGNVIATAVTKPDGSYRFDVVPGDYQVTTVTPTGATHLADTDGGNPNLIAVSVTNANVSDRDFLLGDVIGYAISGTVLADANDNQLIDNPGDTPLLGVVAELRDGDGNLIATTVTDGDGNYSFGNLIPGDYQVSTVTPAGAIHVTDADGNDNGANLIEVTLTTADVTARDFLLENVATYAITGTVFNDSDSDSAFSGGDTPLGGVTVELRDANGTVIATTVTEPDGSYRFDVVPGDYQVTTVTPTGATHLADTDGGNPNLIAVSVTNANVSDRDFLIGDTGGGGLPAYAISGTVLNDSDSDGAFSGGDTPLGGVTVQLLDSAGTVIATTTSDSAGNYAFANLIPGDYQVSTVTPAGATHVLDIDGGNPNLIAVAIVNADVDMQDFLLDGAKTYVLGDRLWLDENSNGVQDAGEAGIANVRVELYDATGTALLATTVTDANGAYLFTGLTAGTYTVQVATTGPNALPGGLAANPTYDLDGIETAHTTLATVGTGAGNLDADFGYNWASTDDVLNPGANARGAIGDRVWIDANGDGVQDPGEPGLGGVPVAIFYDSTGDGVVDSLYTQAVDQNGVSGTGTTTTNPDGSYVFSNLPGGIYKIVVNGGVAPTGYTQTGDPDGVLDNRTTSPIVLAPGDVYVNADFGYRPVSSSDISGTVYFDANANETLDGLETGTSGVTVALLDDDGNTIATTTTGADGTYTFTGLPAGDYTVWVNDTGNLLGGLYQTEDPDATKDSRHTVTVNGTADVNGIDFGYTPLGHTTTTGLIGDTIFLDRNGNNAFDPGEGLQGVTVGLYDSAGTTLIASTVTDANGNYWFGGLADATYVVKVDTSTLPNGGVGLTNTVDPDDGNAPPHTGDSQSTVVISGGTIDLEQDFGYQVLTDPNSISGTIWNDANADGTLDGAEAGRYAGVTVVLRDADGNLVATTTTDATGTYTFDGLPDGTYSVDVTDAANVLNGLWHSLGTAGDGTAVGTPAGESQSDPYSITVAGGADATVDFGYYGAGAGIGDFVWHDVNQNGIQDPDEPGIPGVLVELTITWPNAAGTTVLTTVTGANGFYRFDNLLLDENYTGSGANEPTYSVSIPTLPGMATQTGQGTAGTDSDDPAGTTVTLVQGAVNDSIDFGFYDLTVNAISGTVYFDTDGNGLFGGDTPVGGVTVTLYRDLNGDGVADPGELIGTAITAPDGSYVFPGLPDGAYLVVVTTPDGATNVNDVQGSPTDGLIAVTLTDADATDQDFLLGGTLGTYAISGTVLADLINLGAIDNPGDTSLLGVVVELRDGDGNVIATTTTDSAGNYGFANLIPGDYQVSTLTPAGATHVTDADGDANGANLIEVTLTTADVTARDFLLDNVATYAITGTVFNDSDSDSAFSGGDTPLGGVTVQLLDSDGNVIATTVTEPDGSYRFDVVPGDYQVTTVTPAGATHLADTDGGNPNLIAVTVVDAPVSDRDFLLGDTGGGGLPAYAISGTLLQDTTNPGVINNPGDTPVGGVTVQLRDGDGNLIATTTTDSAGNYSFPNLIPGDYQVRTVTPAGATHVTDADGTGNGANLIEVTLVGTNVTGRDFLLNLGTSVLGDRVWHDTKQNGIQDPDEPGIAGVTVSLSGTDNLGNTIVLTTVTDGSGFYAFPGLLPGTYVVTFTAPSGYSFTAPNQIGGLTDLASAFDSDAIPDDIDPSIGQTPPIVLTGDDPTIDAGLYLTDDNAPARISDRVWYDTNGDGIQNAGEPGVAGVTVELYDSTGTTLIATDVTDGNGLYEFAGLPAGTYLVEFVLPDATWTFSPKYETSATTPAGAGDDSDADTTTGRTDPIVLTAGQQLTEVDAGMRIAGQAPATISDRVWYDTNGDGIQDAGEPGIPGVVVNLYDDTGNFIATVKTDADGLYALTGLPAGDYLVEFELPVGYDSYSPQRTGDGTNDSAPDPATGLAAVTLVAGQERTDIDAGLFRTGVGPITLGNFVWFDANDDGQPGIGEWLDSVDVVLYDALGNELARVTTDSTDMQPSQNYLFTGVVHGDYRVAIDTSTLPDGVSQIADPDAVLDHETELLNQTATNLDVDFGYGPTPVPDLTPVITIAPAAFNGPTNFEVLVEIIELLDVDTSGTITVRVPKDFRWTLTAWDPNATSLPVSARPLDNAFWTISDGGTVWVFEADGVIQGGTQKNFGFSAAWDSGATSGKFTGSVAIVPLSGGEVRIDNNTDAEFVDYAFQ
jgi:protocatechuate 3,4-dioxygenase beta subunit